MGLPGPLWRRGGAPAGGQLVGLVGARPSVRTPRAGAGGRWMARPVPSPCWGVRDLGPSGTTDPAAGERGCPYTFLPGAATLCADPCWGPRVSVLAVEVPSALAPRSGRLGSSLWPCRCVPVVDLAPLWRQVPGWAQAAPALLPLLCSPLLLALLTLVFGNSCRFAESAEGSRAPVQFPDCSLVFPRCSR